ncbi:hypothetical protein [Faecalibacter bovis]|uniref:LPXTG cell wall anchor domain-containing protein n=1 Tax=Faecalibacter bovis TaxID=2898187 RepID=A0ABX7XE85_9FLAO|nr:hypothetical protein [Faecalibacter bovis]QTV06092.1 hypothetical protein J9309_01725 [Faecalibacter bovis]
MKPILKLLTLSTFLFFSSPIIYAQDCGNFDPDCQDGPFPPTPGEGSGAQKVPLDDYTGILLAAGVLAAGIIYYNKEKQIIKK